MPVRMPAPAVRPPGPIEPGGPSSEPRGGEMTPSNSEQRPSPPSPINGAAERVPELEELLQSLEGVESVSIIPGENGGFQEIHVLSNTGLEPKKVVRNVESALLAEAGVKIDHRIISVAQRRSELPEPSEGSRPAPSEDGAVTGGGPAREAAPADRLVLRSVHLERSAGERVTCTVTLEGEESYEGQATGMDHRKTRLTVVGKAVLDALRDVTDDGSDLMLDGVETVNAFGRRVVLALVHSMEHRRAIPLTGAALIEDSPEETAVLAVLDATNRWLANR